MNPETTPEVHSEGDQPFGPRDPLLALVALAQAERLVREDERERPRLPPRVADAPAYIRDLLSSAGGSQSAGIPTAANERGLADFVRAVVEEAVRRAIRTVRDNGETPTVARLADLAVLHLLGGEVTTPDARREAYRQVADVLRRTIRRHAEQTLVTQVPRQLAGSADEGIFEPVNRFGSNVYFAGGPAEAIRTVDWWESLAPWYPEMSEWYALHRFAGRTPEQLAELLGEDVIAVRRRLESAKDSLAEYLRTPDRPAGGVPVDVTTGGIV